MARDGLRLGDEAPDARVRVDTIFASLERLQDGILKAEAVLDRMRASLEVFRKSPEPPGGEGTKP